MDAGDSGQVQQPGESVSVAELGKVVPIAGVPGYRILDAVDDEFVPVLSGFGV
jgi:hypothetical protein